MLNTRVRWLSLVSGVALLAIGLPELFRVGPRYATQSWTAIYGWLPDQLDWIWSAAFVVAGSLALAGCWAVPAMLWSFRLTAALYLGWGLTSMWIWVFDGITGTIPGTASIFLTGCTYALLGHYVIVEARLREKIAIVVEQTPNDLLDQALSPERDPDR